VNAGVALISNPKARYSALPLCVHVMIGQPILVGALPLRQGGEYPSIWRVPSLVASETRAHNNEYSVLRHEAPLYIPHAVGRDWR
jgi:hypothetical protein